MSQEDGWERAWWGPTQPLLHPSPAKALRKSRARAGRFGALVRTHSRPPLRATCHRLIFLVRDHQCPCLAELLSLPTTLFMPTHHILSFQAFAVAAPCLQHPTSSLIPLPPPDLSSGMTPSKKPSLTGSLAGQCPMFRCAPGPCHHTVL